jgi:Amt family ammonium transporter
LFFGFFAFNVGSHDSVTEDKDAAILSLIATNTAIAGSIGAMVGLFIKRWMNRREREVGRWSLSAVLNGCLTGLVAICAGVNVVRPYGALVIGLVAGFIYFIASWIVVKLKIDDPLDAVAVHFGGGLWGVIAVGLLDPDNGFLYCWDDRSILFLLWNLLGVLVITIWSGSLSAVLFALMKWVGRLRVSEEMELAGLDKKHSEPGYAKEESTVYTNGHTALQMSIIPQDVTNDQQVLSNQAAKDLETQFQKSDQQID